MLFCLKKNEKNWILRNDTFFEVTIFKGKHYRKAAKRPITMQIGLDTHGELFLNQEV